MSTEVGGLRSPVEMVFVKCNVEDVIKRMCTCAPRIVCAVWISQVLKDTMEQREKYHLRSLHINFNVIIEKSRSSS